MRFISRFKLLCAIAASIVLTSCASDGNYGSTGQTYATPSNPPTEPILRIDPAMHTAPIYRIATDAEGRWLATASGDKTVRIWGLADGKLISTLRPPIGLGYEGDLNAVAMSPDGSTIAVSGWTRFANGSSLPSSEGSEGFAIYLFDRASGRMLRSITGLSNVVYHLDFSADGRWLAAALASGSGVRIFDSASGQLLAEDRDYGGGHSYSAHFSNDGRLVTTSTDGFLRLYRFDGQSLSLLAKRAVTEGRYPYAARFSPDGNHIAVSLGRIGNGTVGVIVVDARSLSVDYAPDTTDIGGNDDITSVAWSKDGRTLYAGGYFTHEDLAKLVI